MKISKEHQLHIYASIFKFVELHKEEVSKYIVTAETYTNSVGIMWKLYNVTTSWDFKQEIYKYANDEHICTILKRFWKENELLLRGTIL